MEKRKVGRPRKTSNVVSQVKQKEIKFNWKEAYLKLAEADKERSANFEKFKNNTSSLINKMADDQLDVINVVLNAVDSIEEHCNNTLVQTNSLEMSDVTYMVNLAKRRLLATYSQMQNTEE